MTVLATTEHNEQCLVVQWAAANEYRWPELRTLHAVQNWAGVKSPREGARRKKEGIKSGMPDLHLPVARGPWHSLYIEMKRRVPRMTAKGLRWSETKTTPAQDAMHALLREYGNYVTTCTTAELAQVILEEYLKGKL